MMLVPVPLDKLIPIEHVGGVALVNILAVCCLFLGLFLVGLMAKSKLGKTTFEMIDAKLLLLFPGYTYVKSLASSFGDDEAAVKVLKPVAAVLDDQSLLAFEVGRTADGRVVVYFPGAPDPRSGNVAYLTPDRVERLDIPFSAVSNSLRKFGKGSSQLRVPLKQGQEASAAGN